MTKLESFAILSKRAKKIANQICAIAYQSRLQNMKDLLENMHDLEVEIFKTLKKQSSKDHSTLLKMFYDKSGDMLSISNQAIFQINDAVKNKDSNFPDIKKHFLNIIFSLLKSITQLNTYHKLYLNPKFNEHGLTAKDINKRMNDLKNKKTEMDKLYKSF
jgi:hypothetical protein